MEESTSAPEPTAEAAPVEQSPLEAAYAAREAREPAAETETQEVTDNATTEGTESEDSRGDIFERIKRDLSGQAEKTGDSDSAGDSEASAKELGAEETGVEEESADDSDAEKTEAEGTEGLASSESEDTEVKVFKVMDGDKEMDLSSNATLQVKVDGEDVAVSINDLRNNYSGKVAYDRKFQELDGQRKTFELDRDTVNNNVNQFYELASSGQEVAALDFLLEIGGKTHGLDRNTFMNGFAEKVEPQILEWMQMSEEQRHVHQLQSENQYFKRQQESESKRASEEQTRQGLETSIAKIEEVHELDRTQFLKYYDEVASDKEFVGKLSDDEVLHWVERHISNSKVHDQVTGVLTEIDPNLINDQDLVWEFVESVQKMGSGFSTEDLKGIAQEVYGVDKISKELSGRVNKNRGTGVAKASRGPAAQIPAGSNDRLEKMKAELKALKLEF